MTIALHNYGAANADFSVGNFRIVSVPEPGMLAIPLVGFVVMRRRGKRAA